MSNWNERNNAIIEEFRANEGIVGGRFENMTLLLLQTTGAKSGLERINPLVTIQEGQKYLIIASKGGASSNPDWYYNVVANPEVSVEFGSEKFRARAEILTEPERSERYSKMAERYPFFAEYQKNTSRVIPVVILDRL